MPLPQEQQSYTIDDIFDLPDGQRAELIDGFMIWLRQLQRISLYYLNYL